ncbi:hypothetical protein [Flavobacterium facile]|uniref:hypothetical protein n=1 Tax=Flavobacterium facile TaxID=2893174 RepID=UPI002E75F5ED|nr:hypothetical protein [Flavobacterium sp. T-12]
MKRTIIANSEGVSSLNNLLEIIVESQNYNLSIEQKAIKNIAFQISDKIYKLKHKIFKSTIATEKKYKINLQYYECWALHHFIVNLIYLEENEYRKLQLQTISNELYKILVSEN